MSWVIFKYWETWSIDKHLTVVEILIFAFACSWRLNQNFPVSVTDHLFSEGPYGNGLSVLGHI